MRERSTLSVLSKQLYETLELKNLEKCSIGLALADNTIKHALGKVSDVMVELHMNFVPVDFLTWIWRIKHLVLLFWEDLFFVPQGLLLIQRKGMRSFSFQIGRASCRERVFRAV